MNTRTANEAILLQMQGTPDFHPARGFHPASANLFADWTLEPGDVLTVRSEGTDYAVPVYTMDLSWNGDSTVRVQSSGNKQRDPPSELARRNYGYSRGQRKLEEGETEIRAELINQGNSIGLVVTETAGGDKVINVASIVAEINESGDSSVKIDANHIVITGNTGIAGALEVAGFITADSLSTAIAEMGTMTVGDISASSVTVSDELDISGGYITLDDIPVQDTALAAVVAGVRIQPSGTNGYVLQYNTLTDSTWQNAGTFSRATALEGTWDRGILDVEASPQGVHYTDYLGQGTATWNGTTVSIPVTHCISASGTFSNTGYTFSLNTASKLQAKTGSAKITSNGTVAPDSGYIGLSSVEIDVPTGGSSSPSDISLLDVLTWVSYQEPQPSGTRLGSLGTMIQNHKNDMGWIRFSAKLNGVEGTKWYYIPIG